MGNGMKGGMKYFRMPLHYPRYTKDDYLHMSETTLDRLFAEYGLTVQGDIAFKQEFAIGTFLWPSYVDARNSKGSKYN
ncbi:hypothetical protein RND81_08G216400 [Saponaria officinalis]|uniref:DUF7722 domain-containing protein n=1 Tax=Saponaria officinalis TaxID=3572 RepID=A0AAW1JAE4_SAPOF